MKTTKKSVRLKPEVIEGVTHEAIRLDRSFNWTVNHLLKVALGAVDRRLKNKKGTHS
jgi:hypothetical protein